MVQGGIRTDIVVLISSKMCKTLKKTSRIVLFWHRCQVLISWLPRKTTNRLFSNLKQKLLLICKPVCTFFFQLRLWSDRDTWCFLSQKFLEETFLKKCYAKLQNKRTKNTLEHMMLKSENATWNTGQKK